MGNRSLMGKRSFPVLEFPPSHSNARCRARKDHVRTRALPQTRGIGWPVALGTGSVGQAVQTRPSPSPWAAEHRSRGSLELHGQKDLFQFSGR